MSDHLEGWPTGRLLSTAARLVEHAWIDVLAEYGISNAGLVVLHAVAGGPASQREVATAARVTDQTASRTIERLERLGLLGRRPDPADVRRKLVVITERGAEVYRELLERERDDPNLIAALGDKEPELRRLLLELIRAQRSRA